MALTADQITAQNFKDFYAQILPYLNKGNGGTSDTPLGQVAFFDDLVAPYGWLVADGSTYNIADYPDLANQYERVHGSKNYWGGDGTTTFAVPNWQGEFLRASGTNSHANQGSGANVGTHQDATKQPWFSSLHENGSTPERIQINGVGDDTSTADEQPSYYDSGIARKNYRYVAVTKSETVSSGYGHFTSRPTNTSLLLCIKAIPSSEMNTYSLTERRVGTWIDGKPLYERTFQSTLPTVATDGVTERTIVVALDSTIKVKDIDAICIGSAGQVQPDNYLSGGCVDISTTSTPNYQVLSWGIAINGNNELVLKSNQSNLSARDAYITIKYTKTTD